MHRAEHSWPRNVHSGPWNASLDPANSDAVGRLRALVPFVVALPLLALGALRCQSDGGQTGDPGFVPRSGGGKDVDPCRLDAVDPAMARARGDFIADGGVHHLDVIVVTGQGTLRANAVLEATSGIEWSDDCEQALPRVELSLNLREGDSDAGTRAGHGYVEVSNEQTVVGGSLAVAGFGKCAVALPSSVMLPDAGAVASDSVAFVLRCP